jgi:hypothetical protein
MGERKVLKGEAMRTGESEGLNVQAGLSECAVLRIPRRELRRPRYVGTDFRHAARSDILKQCQMCNDFTVCFLVRRRNTDRAQKRVRSDTLKRWQSTAREHSRHPFGIPHERVDGRASDARIMIARKS